MACGELAVGVGGFLGGGQGGLPLPGVGQPDAEVVQRHGQAGEVGVGVGGGELAVGVGGFLGGGQGGLPLPGLASRMPRLFSARARSGRWASGLAAASWR